MMRRWIVALIAVWVLSLTAASWTAVVLLVSQASVAQRHLEVRVEATRRATAAILCELREDGTDPGAAFRHARCVEAQLKALDWLEDENPWGEQ